MVHDIITTKSWFSKVEDITSEAWSLLFICCPWSEMEALKVPWNVWQCKRGGLKRQWNWVNFLWFFCFLSKVWHICSLFLCGNFSWRVEWQTSWLHGDALLCVVENVAVAHDKRGTCAPLRRRCSAAERHGFCPGEYGPAWCWGFSGKNWQRETTVTLGSLNLNCQLANWMQSSVNTVTGG